MNIAIMTSSVARGGPKKLWDRTVMVGDIVKVIMFEISGIEMKPEYATGTVIKIYNFPSGPCFALEELKGGFIKTHLPIGDIVCHTRVLLTEKIQ